MHLGPSTCILKPLLQWPRFHLVEQMEGREDAYLPSIISVQNRIFKRALLEFDAQCRNVEKVGLRHWCHAKSAAGIDTNQAFRDQVRQSLADRADADAIPALEKGERKLRVGCHGPIEDVPTKPFQDLLADELGRDGPV